MTNSTKTTSKGGRSISFPAIALPVAIERIKQFWEKEKKHAVPVTSAIECWGYGAKSSGGTLTIAALINFGLLESMGLGSERRVKITSRALTIIHDPDSNNQTKAIKEAATSPKIYMDLLKHWETEGLPSDSAVKHYLIQEKNLNPNSIGTFIKNFKETISFANLKSSDNISSNNEKNINANNNENHLADNIPLSIQSPFGTLRQDSFSLDEGQAILNWPSNMTKESFEDFKSWLELQIRKISRSIKNK